MSFKLEVEGATLIVGSGGHLMSAVSIGVASAGSYVICADSSLENAQKTSNRILELGYSTEAMQMDVKTSDSIQMCFESLKSRGIFVRNLVNGAGINAPTPFFEIRRPEWDEILNVQLIGVAETCRIFGTEMVARGDGNIINISSASANPPLSRAFVYSSAKAAVLNLTKNLAREWGTSGVRVNAIRPGFFPTAWNLEKFIDDERKESIIKHTPMKRFGIPEELVSSFVWLLSNGSSFTTGSEIAIDGGFSAMSI